MKESMIELWDELKSRVEDLTLSDPADTIFDLERMIEVIERMLVIARKVAEENDR